MAKGANSSRHSSILDIIDRIEKTGEVLGDRASFLSDLIATIDDRLRDMPGKVEASASGDDFRLSFERRDAWALWLYDYECDRTDVGEYLPDELTTVSVGRKARAFPTLLMLLEQIEEVQKQQLNEVVSALSLLKTEGK